MDLPNIIRERLSTDPQLHGVVAELLAVSVPILSQGGMTFFPEYTDHSDHHSGKILDTVCSLMNDAAQVQFSAADAALITIGSVAHDLAMHLTEDGFEQLRKSSDNRLSRAQDIPWSVLWRRFFAEVQRYDSRQLISLFGDSEPVRVLPDDPKDFTYRDRLLIGEFIRRWHHRLAHEFLIWGIPARDRMLQLIEADPRFTNLAGLIARSHGMAIRDLFPDLRQQYSIRAWRGAHPVFLMVLLRIADFLHIEPNRAPSALLTIKGLRSPVSQREWAINQAIDDVRHAHEDPEAIEIDSFPESMATYRRMKAWLHAFQGELDGAWAVLGETYGRYTPQKELGIVIRRVKSNLDDTEAFGRRAAFVPRVARFDAAGADMLKLLVKPLYGNRPAVAIRELVQNGVDAVLERRALNLVDSNDQTLDPPYNGDVVVLIEQGTSTEAVVSLIDRGVGMTPDTICDYFLRIGASFRRSEAWRSHFEQTEGKSVVLRSGRFGMGVLAAFILGDEIEVTTRHATAPADRAVSFKSRIDDDEVDLRWTTASIGTTIRIRVTMEAIEQLIDSDWDWYCLRSPSVRRWVGPVELPQRFEVPEPGEPSLGAWRRFEPRNFQAVLWSYTADAPLLSCNGFTVIREGGKSWRTPGHSLQLRKPKVAVFDPDGYLPLTILRNELTEATYPFDEELFEEVLIDLLAYIIARGPVAPLQSENIRQYLGPRHPGLFDHGQKSLYVSTTYGFALSAPTVLRSLGLDRVFVLAPPRTGTIPDEPIRGNTPCVFQFVPPDTAHSPERGIELLVRTGLEDFTGVRVITTEKDRHHEQLVRNFELERKIRLEERADELSIWVAGTCEPDNDGRDLLTRYANLNRRLTEEARRPALTSPYAMFYNPRRSAEPSRLAQTWHRTLGAQLIPYSLKERKSLFEDCLPGLYDRYAMRLSEPEETTQESPPPRA